MGAIGINLTAVAGAATITPPFNKLDEQDVFFVDAADIQLYSCYKNTGFRNTEGLQATITSAVPWVTNMLMLIGK